MTQKTDNVEEFKRAVSACLRAMAERPDLTVSYGSEAAGFNGDRVRLPTPPRDLGAEELASTRGAADQVALRIRHHDAGIHARRMPQGDLARAAYEAMEQARCEAIGARNMSGVAGNIAAVLDERYRRQGFQHATTREDVPLAEVLRLMAREALTGAKPPAVARQAVELWRPWIESKAGRSLLELGKLGDDQSEYARAMRRVLHDIDLDAGLDEEPEPDERDDEEPEEEEGEDQEQQQRQGEEASTDPENLEGDPDEGEEIEADGAADDMDGDTAESAASEDPQAPGKPWERAEHELNDPDRMTYKAYTTQFDEVVEAADLCDADELARLRLMLDQQLHHMQGAISRLANRLQRRLLARQTRSWAFDLEEGMLDAARLARVVVNPLTPLSFKVEKDTDFRDTVVTLLIDNSGSMRGRPIGIAAISADILARTLERCGVKVEILGFTTRAWKGGMSRETWIQAGKPQLPGRLNDLRHIVYKNADAPWRRARRNLGLMLREGVLKENIDGEALVWAHERLLTRPEQRRVLMVISDGAPVDDSTLSANPGNYLERHLKQVINWIETYSPVELIAIGIGHDVTRYYSRAVTITDAEQLGGTMVDQLAGLFDEPPPPRAAGRQGAQQGTRRRLVH
ncbi:MAG: cobaltochelatase subunit CobT [Azospirillaceae bacterium]